MRLIRHGATRSLSTRCELREQSDGSSEGAVLTRSGEVIDEADEHAATIYADIDVDLLATTRRNLPVTVQRRFEVYPDVSKQ